MRACNVFIRLQQKQQQILKNNLIINFGFLLKYNSGEQLV